MNIPPNGVAATVTALATLISEKFNDDEVALLAAVLTQLGDTLATISVAKSIQKNNQTEDK